MIKSLFFATLLTLMPLSLFAKTFTTWQLSGNDHLTKKVLEDYIPYTFPTDLDAKQIETLMQSLYATGFFETLAIYDDAGTLLIEVQERPSIVEINTSGNELIPKEQLEKVLEGFGLKKGKLYKRLEVDKVILALKQRYSNEGYYAAQLDLEVENLNHNRVKLNLKIQEGSIAKIDKITFVGNQAFTSDRLRSRMLSQESTPSAAFSAGDQYSKYKFAADQETIRSYYMDRGYAKFQVVSSQVSLSGDKRFVYLTMNLNEGALYHFDRIDILGELPLLKQELMDKLRIKTDEVFNRSQLIQSMEAIKDRLSEDGYAFADVRPELVFNEEQHRVAVNFHVTPYNRVYVNQILIQGNIATEDKVIRRELRQLEAAPYSLSAIRTSKARLQRLGYFKNVNFQTTKLTSDLVNIVVEVEERPTGAFQAALGYSQVYGSSFRISLTEDNALGTGFKTNITINTSSSQDEYEVSVTDPYFLTNGVSLTGRAFYSHLNTQEVGLSNYVINKEGFALSYGVPVSDNMRFNAGVQYTMNHLICESSYLECNNFVAAQGADVDDWSLTAVTTHDTRNDTWFPSDGHKVELVLESSLPEGDITFYKAALNQQYFQNLGADIVFASKLDISTGGGYGNISSLPFYERYYAGGINSVRGYASGTLGVHYDYATDGTSLAKGGDFATVGSLRLLSPMPGVEDSGNMRLSLFYDVGSVYKDSQAFDSGKLAQSVGFGFNWITPIGPLVFSWADAISHPYAEEETQFFQFSLGGVF